MYDSSRSIQGSACENVQEPSRTRRRCIAISGHNYFLQALLCIIGLFIITDFNSKQSHFVISAHLHQDFRCSHVPPPPEQVRHVWLDDVNFSAAATDGDGRQSDAEVVSSRDTKDKNEVIKQSHTDARSRRHIDSSINGNSESKRMGVLSQVSPDESERFNGGFSNVSGISSGGIGGGFQETLWNLLKRLERPILPLETGLLGRSKQENHNNRDDLVPMKIQVHYDPSVYLLEKKKLNSINGTVIPTVVKFFEDVLLIRREYTIDKFRISRRCPNNTIYYAKDVIGSSRPYCMDHCEDHAVCGEMIVPQEHLSACSYCNVTSRRCTTDYATEGKGVANTQLLLYVSARQTVRCKKDQTIAYAAHCAQDTKTDRPVAGHANLCPSSISTDPKDLKALIATVKHELTHVLGFSVSLFAYYRDEHGQPLTERESIPGPIPVDPKTGYAKWSDKVIRKVVRPNWVTGEGSIEKEVHMVVTPTVVREVRRHFNCSSLEGAELEDQGSDGTSMTHWEKRLYENEAMTGTHTQNSVYSRITLAVLQDTGWYVANFSSADKLDWGKDLGCDFAKKSCKSWIDERRAKRLSIRPFCDRIKGDLLQIACTEDRSSKAVCNMRHYKDPLPGVYRNFDQLDGADEQDLAHYGGSVDLADYCPFIQEFTWQVQNVTVRGSRCDLGGNNIESERNAALEHYGVESRCFEHGRRWEQRSCTYKRHWHHFGAGCYKFTCSNGHINIIVGNRSHPCYYTDQLIHIEHMVDQWLYNGSLVCPPCDKICSASKCAKYDKRLIDRILTVDRGNNTDEKLRAILDESFNEIDTQGADSKMKKSFAKYKLVMQETNQLLFEHSKIKDNIISQQGVTKQSYKHLLLCSSASYLKPPLLLTLVLLLFCTAFNIKPFLN